MPTLILEDRVAIARRLAAIGAELDTLHEQSSNGSAERVAVLVRERTELAEKLTTRETD